MSYIWRIRNEVPETNQCTVDLKIHEFGLLWSRRIHLTEPFKVYSMKLSQLITKIFGYIKISSLIFIVLLGIYGLIIGVGDLTIWTYPKRLTLLIIMRDIRHITLYILYICGHTCRSSFVRIIFRFEA